MDISFRDEFIRLWKQYFNNADLPLAFYYTNEEGHADLVKPGAVPRCVIGALMQVREGASLCFDAGSVGCFGGRRYLGFQPTVRPDFEYFLSCGIPGKVRGERYKKSPEMVREMLAKAPAFEAPAPFAVFKRWDKLDALDSPDVVIFFAEPDVLAGLFTLSSFDETESTVAAPFGSGCSSIVQNPYLEKDAAHPRAIIGMFDPSARPFVPKNMLSFAVPMSKFSRMVANMPESFLTTDDWKKVQKRIGAS